MLKPSQMDNERFLQCLASDYARLREVALVDQSAAVPTCPGWTVADLTRHVGEVYLHKTRAMQEGKEPDESWPPPELAQEEPVGLLDRSYQALTREFATRKPSDPAGTWYKPDQTVGFWIRRMAQETVIHRIDAELGTAQPVAEVPTDLALDGIDELLKVFVAYSVAEWGKYFTDVLGNSSAATYTVRANGSAWRVQTAPGRFEVTDGTGNNGTDVTISGSATEVLRWVWNREGPEAVRVSIEGPQEAVARLKRCIATATQ